jgi:hypothetical protein
MKNLIFIFLFGLSFSYAQDDTYFSKEDPCKVLKMVLFSDEFNSPFYIKEDLLLNFDTLFLIDTTNMFCECNLSSIFLQEETNIEFPVKIIYDKTIFVKPHTDRNYYYIYYNRNAFLRTYFYISFFKPGTGKICRFIYKKFYDYEKKEESFRYIDLDCGAINYY